MSAKGGTFDLATYAERAGRDSRDFFHAGRDRIEPLPPCSTDDSESPIPYLGHATPLDAKVRVKRRQIGFIQARVAKPSVKRAARAFGLSKTAVARVNKIVKSVTVDDDHVSLDDLPSHKDNGLYGVFNIHRHWRLAEPNRVLVGRFRNKDGSCKIREVIVHPHGTRVVAPTSRKRR